jgi:hypothetical protein
MVAPFIALSLALLPLQSPGADLEQAKRRFSSALGPVAKREQVAIVADVDLNAAPPATFDELRGRDRLKVIAQAMNRDLVPLPFAQLFVRRMQPAHGSLRHDARTLLTWLEHLSKHDLDRLAIGDYTVGELPAGQRAEILSALVPDPDSLAAALDPRHDPRISLQGTLHMEFSDARGETHRLTLPTPRPSAMESMRKSAPATGKDAPQRELEEEPFPTSSGPIKFEAEVLTLRELVQRLQSHLEQMLIYDTRLAGSTYFIDGEFTAANLLMIVQRLASAEPLRLEKAPSLEVEERVRNLLLGSQASGLIQDKGLQALDAQQWLRERELSAERLAAASQFAGDVLKQFGADTGREVRIRPALSFWVETPGSRPVQGGQRSNTTGYVIY